jgi:hypothetical protein
MSITCRFFSTVYAKLNIRTNFWQAEDLWKRVEDPLPLS